MTTIKVGLSADKKTVALAAGADAIPGGYTNLGTFDHNESDDPVHAHGANHVLFHHVRDILYKRKAADGTAGATHPDGIYDMARIKIERTGPVLLAQYVTGAAVTVADPGTVPIVVKYQPQNVNANNADFTFVSANPAVATVNAAGVVTGVANGSTKVTATSKIDGKKVEVDVSIT